MKQKILDALRTKFSGVSDAILSRTADKLALKVQNDDQVTTAIEGVTFSALLESYGDFRANEASVSAVNNYELKHGLKNGVKIEGAEPKQPQTQSKQSDEMPEWAKQLLEQNKQLTERINKAEAEKVTASRREQINQIASKLPENLRGAYSRISVDNLNDGDFESLKNELTTEIDGIASSLKAKGAVFGGPNVHTGGNSDELTKEQIEKINNRPGVNSNEQPF